VPVLKAAKQPFRSQIQSSKRGSRNQDEENDENSFRAGVACTKYFWRRISFFGEEGLIRTHDSVSPGMNMIGRPVPAPPPNGRRST
jgi:hypothetical protein